jgi:hypothetical protein
LTRCAPWALACGVCAQLREFLSVRRGHLGQPLRGVGEPGEDLVPFPFVVGADLAEFPCGVFPGPRGLCACVFGACVRGRGALVGLRGLREGLVAGVLVKPLVTGGTVARSADIPADLTIGRGPGSRSSGLPSGP